MNGEACRSRREFLRKIGAGACALCAAGLAGGRARGAASGLSVTGEPAPGA